MVQLRLSLACKEGRHDECNVGYTPPKRNGKPVFGGWHCTCPCHKKDAWEEPLNLDPS